MPAIDVDVVRSLSTASELRSSDKGSDSLGVLSGHFSVFGNWYRISSVWEGKFLERLAPGAFSETLAANRDQMRSMFDHGFDTQIGSKSLGAFRELREDETGGYYEIDLDDTTYNRDLLPGFKRGAYGSSFRMHVKEDSWVDKPLRSEHNPEGIPERTITRTEVAELGPVAWPANPLATAIMRSDTDQFYSHLRQRDQGAFEEACRAANIEIPDVAAANPRHERDGGSEHDSEPGKAAQSQLTYRRKALHRAIKMRGILNA